MRFPMVDYTKWQKWYAWRPVQINKEIVWFEDVYYRRHSYGHDGGWEYETLDGMLRRTAKKAYAEDAGVDYDPHVNHTGAAPGITKGSTKINVPSGITK